MGPTWDGAMRDRNGAWMIGSEEINTTRAFGEGISARYGIGK